MNDSAQVDKNNISHIVGITDGHVKSLGTIHTILTPDQSPHSVEKELSIVPKDFPIPADGILGKDFIKLRIISNDIYNSTR